MQTFPAEEDDSEKEGLKTLKYFPDVEDKEIVLETSPAETAVEERQGSSPTVKDPPTQKGSPYPSSIDRSFRSFFGTPETMECDDVF